MIEAYLQRLAALVSVSPLVRGVKIVRRAMRDTEFEKVLHYQYRVLLANGDFLALTERVLATRGRLEVTRYRHPWPDRHGWLLTRWDKAPDYPAIDTFTHPHNLYDGAEEYVVRHPASTGLEVLHHLLEAGEVQAERQGERPGAA